MGTLANSLFQAMLGWIRTLASSVWSAVTAPESANLLTWIGANWKMLALLLCVVGLVTDLIIYLLRWQPWRAWGSFFRRLGNREPEEMMEIQAMTPAYAFEGPQNEYSPDESDPEEEDDWEDEPSREPEEPLVWTRNEPEGTTASFEQAIRPRRRRRVTHLFSEGEEETARPEELIDRYAAYRRPVYPRSWKAEEGDEDE